MPPTQESNSPRSDSPDMASKYKEILKSNGIHDTVSEVIFIDSGLKGENMGSETEYVTIKFENPSKRPLNLFVKRQISNAVHLQFVEEAKLFQKETMFYRKYLTAAREHCKAMGKEELMSIYPKCYYGDDTMLIFENLVVDKGYELLKKEERQGYDAARLAITNLAKHHAIGHALINECGGPKEFFNRFPHLKFESFHQPSTQAFLEPSFENGINTNMQILEKSGITRSSEVLEQFKQLKGVPFKDLLEALENKPGDFLVLNHGDYWNNNMMFLKDKKTNEIIDHVAVDFQVSRYASPAVDIAYFLFSSVKAEVRRTHLQALLKTYFDVLKATANDLGHQLLITFEDIKAEFYKKFKYGFWFGSLLLSEASYSVLKHIDMSQLVDFSEWAEKLNELIREWLDEHPEKCQENAREIIRLMDECDRLASGKMTYIERIL